MARVVLIVEDSPDSVASLEMALLALPDLEVKVSGTAREALKFLRDGHPRDIAAVLTDLEMPSMDGFELIRRVRSDPRYRRLPIIVLSGNTDPTAPERALSLGANAYFAKPYSPAAVRNQLEKLLNANPS